MVGDEVVPKAFGAIETSLTFGTETANHQKILTGTLHIQCRSSDIGLRFAITAWAQNESGKSVSVGSRKHKRAVTGGVQEPETPEGTCDSEGCAEHACLVLSKVPELEARNDTGCNDWSWHFGFHFVVRNAFH